MSEPPSLSDPLPAELGFERRLEEARESLPDLVRGAGDDPLGDDARQVAERLARRIAEMPPGERRQIRRRIAVAINDLEGLVGELEGELSTLSEDLRALNRHGGAARAYLQGAVVAHDRSS
ncbi:hypothetical protein [Phaeospirillum tilakii]|uniref:Uncharacterized protein n=1 Tax=Phaeospirillum tilakii TaxID=741673 RepID=A0ABW5CEN0_9PROT